METLLVLDQILAFFDGALNVALPILDGSVRFLFQSFLVITIVFSGATYAFGNTSVGVEFLLKKILLVGGALFLVTNWLDVTNVVVSSFGVLGLRAGGIAAVQLTTADLFSPSRIAGIGVEFADELLTLAGNEVGIFNGNNGAALLLLVAALVMGLSFIIIALQVFMALIEFKLVTLGGFVLLPFALIDRTASLAQGVLGYVIAAGLKIFVLAIVISLAAAFVDALVSNVIGRWIQWTRSKSVDPIVLREHWDRAYQFVPITAKPQIDTYARDIDAFNPDKIGKEAVTVEIVSVTRQSQKTFQVRWQETAFADGHQQGRQSYTANVTVDFLRPTSHPKNPSQRPSPKNLSSRHPCARQQCGTGLPKKRKRRCSRGCFRQGRRRRA